MKQEMSRRMRISSRMIVAGCSLYAVYGILAAVFRESIAVYQYRAFSGGDLGTLVESSQHFTFDLVLLVGLLGAGLSICAGALFWLAFTRRLGSAFILVLVASFVGLAPLSTVHMAQGAWILFMVDGICLAPIAVGLLFGIREIPKIFRGKGEGA